MMATLLAIFLSVAAVAAAVEAPVEKIQSATPPEWAARLWRQATPAPLETREVTTTARFERKEGTTYLQLREGIFYLDLPWIGHPADTDRSGQASFYYPVTLEAGQTYRFTFEERPRLFTEGLKVPTTFPFYRPQFYETKLTRITQRGAVLYDREICEIHHCKMPRVDVPVLYGLAPFRGKIPSPELRKSFPHFQEFTLGGCVVVTGPGITRKTTEPKFVCPECKRAYAAWAGETEPVPRR